MIIAHSLSQERKVTTMRLIDADALPIHKAYCVDEAGWGTNFYVVDKSDIDNAPTIDAVPVVHGRWEYSENIYDESTWVCSICKEPWTLIDGTPQENGMKYCPNCGKKMDLEE